MSLVSRQTSRASPPGLAIWQANSFGGGYPFVLSAGGGFSDTRVGWTAGRGAEWMFLPNWSAKLEYLYYDLGRATYALSPLATQSGFLAYASAVTASPRFDGHVVRAGLNYHLDFGGPDLSLAR